jgi:biopolymer transport protein ExbD
MGVQLDASGGGKGKRKRHVKPTMNVTPLVDVVLVLLIIFMVITPLMVKQLSVNVPVKDDKDKKELAEPASPDDDPEPQVVLRVVQTGHIYINKTPVSEEQLGPKLRRIFAARADQTLFFDADDRVPFGRAARAIDIARGIGLKTIAVLTEPLVISGQ